MNQQAYEAGVAAYQRGDWTQAAYLLREAVEEGELNGRANHLRGNALMKLGRFDDAAAAYQEALNDTSYGRSGALHTNMGRALEAAGRIKEAVDSLTVATQDASYKTPYKAYNALGGAYTALGDIRSAGIAYRNAAIDESNPDPSTALRKLGSCFMDLGRASDAVEAYRTALDFVTPNEDQNVIYCELALAYVASNRMSEAVDAFQHATEDGTFKLSPEAQASYDAARNAAAARAKNAPSETDDLLAAAGYGPMGVDPLDPTGETTGNLMPSPEDTGFFSVTEEELVNNAKAARKGERKKKHTGRKVLVTLLVIILVLAAACGVCYYLGLGFPSQQQTVNGLFSAKTNQGDAEQYVQSSLSDAERTQIVALVPSGATIQSIDSPHQGFDNMSTTVSATASLSDGSSETFQIGLVRDGLGWKVSSLIPTYDSASTTPAANANAASANANTSSDAGNTAATNGSADSSATTTDTASGDTSTTSGSIATTE